MMADAEHEGGRAPEPPRELWLLWDAGGECWVPSIDDAPGGFTALAAFSEAEAGAAARHQNETYGSDGCVPVRVI